MPDHIGYSGCARLKASPDAPSHSYVSWHSWLGSQSAQVSLERKAPHGNSSATNIMVTFKSTDYGMTC